MVAFGDRTPNGAVNLLRLQIEDRVGVADGAQEQAFGVLREGRADDLDAGSLRVLRLHRVRVKLRCACAAAERCPERDLGWEAPPGAVAVAGQLWTYLVECLVRE